MSKKEASLGIWNNFTNLYPVQKTLRFELVPVGKTEENIIKNDIISAEWKDGKNISSGRDAERAENYNIAKQMLNQMHSLFIDQALSAENIQKFEKEDQKLSTPQKKVPSWKDLLKTHFENWKSHRRKENTNSEKLAINLEKSKSELYKKFAKLLNFSGAQWKSDFEGFQKNISKDQKQKIKANKIEVLFKNTNDPIQLLIYHIKLNRINIQKEDGSNYSQDEMFSIVQTFESFGTYFSGFNQNRANVYNTDGEISTSLAYRLFEQNIEFFFSNIERWETFQRTFEQPDVKNELKQKNWDIKKKLKEVNTDLVQPRFDKTLEAVLQPESFVLLFNQNGIDHFNEVIGGLPAEPGKDKVQGLNEIINLTRQKVSNADKKKYPSLQTLYKQILSERKGNFIDQFEDEKEMIESIKEFHEEWKNLKIRNPQMKEKLDAADYLKKTFNEVLQGIENDPELKNGYFLGEKAIQELSIDILGGYNTIHKVWYGEIDSMMKDDGKPIPKKDQEKFKKKKYFSFSQIEELVTKYVKHHNDSDTKIKKDSLPYKKEWQNTLSEYFSIKTYIEEKLKQLIVGNIKNKYSKIIEKVIKDSKGDEKTYQYYVPSLLTSSSDKDFERILSKCSYVGTKEKSVDKIKEYLDASLQLTKFVESFRISERDIQNELSDTEILNASSQFNTLITDWLSNQFDMVLLYNKVRNFVTKKAGSTDKIKVNFENATLLDGWDADKESANYGFLLKKRDYYYLGVADSSFNTELKNFDSENRNKTIEDTSKNLKKLETKKKPDHEKIQDLKEYLQELDSITNFNKGRYQKIRYKFMPDVAKMIPKCTTQLKPVKAHFISGSAPYILEPKNTKSSFLSPLKVSKEIFLLNNKVYNKDLKKFVLKQAEEGEDEPKGVKKFQKEYLTLTKDEKGYKEALEKWIDFCKEFTKTYGSCTNFDYSLIRKTKEYKQLDEFYKDLNSVGYVLDFVDISEEYINKKIDEGKLYLFKIHNKDFSPNKKNKNSKDNLHTTYWKMLFNPENLKDVVLKLNGQAEIFFRPASIHNKDRTIHKANESIENKNPHATKKHSRFDYDIIKDKRFTQNKFLFHCPITLNFKADGNPYINSKIQENLAKNPDVNIIGIDRGEKHLLYYTVIDQKGEILESGSLNTIQSEYKDKAGKEVPFETPYHAILDKKENERKDARVSWKEIDSIKDLKSGYLSHVVHKIAKLVIKHNAIVVLEDLNFGFKRGRFKVEKQVYQKFEKALIEKLNYLVFKDKTNLREPGGFLKAYQLTDKFVSFEKLGKQSGILFYTAASYTSKVDPVTGFMQNYYSLFDPAKVDQFLGIFESIVFNGTFFEITYDLGKNYDDKESHHFKSKWTVCTCVNRSEYNPDTKTQKCFDVNQRLIELFKKYEISYKKGEDILEKIKTQDTKFLKLFHYYFMAIQKMRVVDPTEEKGEDFNDYIQSPVYPYYNSREIAKVNSEVNKLPANGDANGAYNIARKGIITLDKIHLRVQIEKLYGSEKFDWQKASTLLPKISDKKILFSLFEEWGKKTCQENLKQEDLFDGNMISKKGEEFLKFFSDLKVSKAEWEIYTQNQDTVQRQIQVWKKITKP
jgi:hypothetical protein